MNSAAKLAASVVAAFCCGQAAAGDAAVPANWITIQAGKFFSFRAPPDTTPYSDGGKPIDSFVGLYRNSQFTLGFDYGLYSSDLADLRSNPKYSVETTSIDGRKAIIESGPGRNHWGCNDQVSAVYLVVSHRWWSKGDIRLQMEGCTKNPENISLIHAVFKSLRFSKE